MWLLHIKQTDGVAIKHARNRREYRLPELPHYNVYYYAETNKFTSFSNVIGMATPVNRFVTSSPQTETPYHPDINRQWHDWNR